MIEQALQFIQGELNNFLARSGLPQDRVVVLSSLAAPQGGVAPDIEQQLVLTLINIEREATLGAPSFMAQAGGAYARTQQALHLNLIILLSASYSGDYPGALRALGAAMSFLQAKPAYDSQNSDDFPPAMSQLTMEFISLSLGELGTLWTVLGANYLPSAVYKLRMISLNAQWTVASAPAIDKIAPTIGVGT